MTIKLIIIFLIILVAILAYDTVRIYFLFQKTIELEKSSVFERTIPGASFRILVLGDSTAVGTGASKPEDSTAGRLAAKYPNAEVVNLAKSGDKIEDLEWILKTISDTERYDIVLIQIGANDIIRFTSMKDIEEGIGRILERSKTFRGKVIILHSGNIGESKFFPWYVRPLLSKRSYEAREIYKRVAEKYGASYVNLIDVEFPEKYYASDHLHLSSDGYGVWFEEIEKKL